MKIRGTALHVAEKYVQLARDAQSAGDRVAGENYLQHAEHYYRLVAAAQAQMPQPQPFVRNDDEVDDEEDQSEREDGFPGDRQPVQGQAVQPAYQADAQPRFNGNGQSAPDDGGGRGQPGSENQARFDNRENRGQGDRPYGERGDFRGRRRRPFRERYSSDQGAAPRDNAPDTGPAPETPTGED